MPICDDCFMEDGIHIVDIDEHSDADPGL
jgi:hypothetical protein